MKALVLSLLLISLISCHPEFSNERHKRHRAIMQEKIKSCIYNSTASETLKNAFKENSNSNEEIVFSTLKSKLEDSDKVILRSCRKEAFKTLRKERFKHFHGPHHHDVHDDSPRPSSQAHLRNLEVKSPKFTEVKKNVVSCIEKTPNISDNLKKFLSDNKESEQKNFFKAMKESLTDEEKKIVRKCRRQVLKSMFQLKMKKNK